MGISGMGILAIVLAAIAAYAFGAIWYGPIFGKQWQSLNNFGNDFMEKAKAKMAITYGGAFFFYILASVAMYFLLLHFPTHTTAGDGHCWKQGMEVGLACGSVAASTVFINGLFGFKPTKLLVIDSLNLLIGFAIGGIVLGAVA